MRNIQYLLVFIFCLLNEDILSKPTKTDYLRTGAGIATLLYTQFFYKSDIADISKYKVENVNSFDSFMRSKIIWNDYDLKRASFYSDILLYGIALGSVPFTSLVLKSDFEKNILFFLNTISLNTVITNLVKNISSRERPLYRYNLSKTKTNESYKSFYSGHTSTAFTIATCTSLLLSRQFPQNKKFIWLSSFSLSSLTGYFRIASDNHYTSDVFFGGMMGIITGYLMHEAYFKQQSKLTFTMNSINYSINL